ncbi:hypothetical protein ONS95_013866 [Cadophora gregata]|uniref:uncharacterized protein n=1 Tax=Cadophora gregata TaxID=51156 RepID=UPI0026DCEA0E|nr:uncharacterized protein ONS95_013866 [Cadophora gregata]KAK0113621.1 hypothetical protein ONS96_014476 [Cadophora gregata f. sp. sojae]KAK0114374.1 hypothetical protein ONS95_013866 [Cadophora gregata]
MKLIYLETTLLVLLSNVYAQVTTLSTLTSYSISYETPPVVQHTITFKNVYTLTLPDGKVTTSTEIPPTQLPISPTATLEESKRTAGGVYTEATTITKTIEGCSVTQNVDCKTTITSTNKITMTTTVEPVTSISTATSCPPGGTGVTACQTRTDTFTTLTTKLIPVNTVTEIKEATTVLTKTASVSSSASTDSTVSTSSSSTAESTPTSSPSSTESISSIHTSLSSTSKIEATPSPSSTASSTETSSTSSSTTPSETPSASTPIQTPTPTPSPPIQIPIASTASATSSPLTDLCGEEYTFAGALPTGLIFDRDMTVIARGTMYSVPSGKHVVGTATGLGAEQSPKPDSPKLKRSRFWAPKA